MDNTRARSRRTVSAVLSLCLILTLGACSKHHPRTSTDAASPGLSAQPEADASAAASVSPTSGGSLTLPDGARVDVPAGAVTGAGQLTGALAAAPAGAPAGLLLDGAVHRFEITGAHQRAPVTVTLPVTGPAAQTPAAVLAYFDQAAARWVVVPSTFDPTRHTVSGATSHLSLWAVLRADTGKLLAAATDSVKGFFGIADTTAQPTCPGSDEARTLGVTAGISPGGLIKGCYGARNGQPLIRVANNRTFPVEVDYPAYWAESNTSGWDDVDTVISTDVGQLITVPPTGQRALIIPGGSTVEFTAPAGTSGTASFTPSGSAFLAAALSYGVQTLLSTYAATPFASAPTTTKTVAAIKGVFAAKDCVTSMVNAARVDTSDFHGFGQLFRNTVDLATGCLLDSWKVAYGMSAFTAAFFVAVVLWLIDGIHLVIQGIQGSIEAVKEWRGYYVRLSSAPSNVVVFGGYGPVVAGMTETQVEQISGAAPQPSENLCDAVPLGGVDQPGGPAYVTILRSTGKVVGVYPPRNARTATGVGAGSTVAQIESSYPGATFTWFYGQASWSLLVTQSPGSQLSIGFPVPGGNGPGVHPGPGDRATAVFGGIPDFTSSSEICI